MIEAGAASGLQLRVARDLVAYTQTRRLPVGTHLCEQALATRFEVSRSPVRAALRYLHALGVLERRANRGFFLCKTGRDIAGLEIASHRSRNDRVYERVARDWLQGRAGAEFSEAGFRRRYQVGRGACAKILNKLSKDGIISRLPGHGWRFLPALDTRSAHDESYQIRLALEPAGLLLPTFTTNVARFAELRQRHERTLFDAARATDIIAQLLQLDADFHRTLAECSGNRFFLAAIETQNALRRLAEYTSSIDTHRLNASCLEHLDILQAVELGDRKKAAGLMRRHLQRAQRYRPKSIDT